MEPGVPFALLGAVQLLAMAGWVGLAGAAVVRRGRRAPGLALPVLLAGAVLLVVADGRTALGFDSAVSDEIAVLRSGGLLLLGLGIYLGALQPVGRRLDLTFDGAQLSVAALPGVVVPLGANSTPALLGGIAGLLAGGAALRVRRDTVGLLLGVGLLLAGASALAAEAGDGHSGAIVVLLLRGGSAVLVLGALTLLARSSLLSKVVAAILGGILVMAVAAVGVVGTVVVSSYDRQDKALVADTATQRKIELDNFKAGRTAVAKLLAIGDPCDIGGKGSVANCNSLFRTLTVDSPGDFLVNIPQVGPPVQLGPFAQQGVPLLAKSVTLSPSELIGIGQIADVADQLRETCRPGTVLPTPLTGTAQLTGAEPTLVAYVAQAAVCGAQGTVPRVLFYATKLDDDYADDNISSGDFTFSILVGGDLVASNGSEQQKGEIVAAARRANVEGGVGKGVLVGANGLQPTFDFIPIEASGEANVVLAIGRDSEKARDAEQRALRYLIVTSLLATLLVGALALLLGRRTVDPVRRLTLAAERVAAGDLSVRTGIRSEDEVGALSAAFDSMTTSLEAVQDDLRSSAGSLRTILTSVSEGLVATDADGLVTSINPAALAMAGLAEEWEALGIALGEVLVTRDSGGEALELTAPIRGADAEVVHAGADGEEVVTAVRVEVAPLAGGDGGVVVVLRDMHREREVERMKTEFLSNVSHELRTPLTPIRGYADLLASRKNLKPEQVKAFAGTILSESLKMNRVVDLLVDVAAIEAGRVHISPRTVTVASIIDERLALWKQKAPQRADDLGRRVSRGLAPVLVDPAWIGKALDELVDNALKHTPPGTKVTLAAGPGPDGQVRVSVADRGPGIAEQDQALLFTSFEQVDGSATRRVGGLGLGLSFVSRLAEHGGYPLTVVSATGKGAEFSLDLPASPEAVTAVRRTASPRPGSRAGRRPARGPSSDR